MPITKATASSIAPAAKGDLVVGSATNDAAVLGVGSNDQVLTADSSTATGLKWGTPSGGGMTLIQETTASALSSLSFSSIPGTYKDLVLEWCGIQHSASDSGFVILFNNNSTGVYNSIGIKYSASTPTISGEILTNSGESTYWPAFGGGANRTTTQNDRAQGYMKISNYASSTLGKVYQSSFYYRDNNNSEFRGQAPQQSFFNSTSAITSIDIVRTYGTATFSNIANTSIRLYGVS